MARTSRTGPKTARLNLRLSAELDAQIEEICRLDTRNKTQVVEIILHRVIPEELKRLRERHVVGDKDAPERHVEEAAAKDNELVDIMKQLKKALEVREKSGRRGSK